MNDIIIFGTGGHAKVVYDILLKQKLYNPSVFVSLEESITHFLGVPHIQQTNFEGLKINEGVVAIGDNYIRSQVVALIRAQKPNFQFIPAIHPSAQIASDVIIGDGTVVMANVAINSGMQVGSHSILNTSSSVDHDCKIGHFSSIAPGCVLGGNVEVGDYSAISLGANIIHGKKIGEHTVIGAGSLVLDDIESFKVAYGNPCKVIRSRVAGEKYL